MSASYLLCQGLQAMENSSEIEQIDVMITVKNFSIALGLFELSLSTHPFRFGNI